MAPVSAITIIDEQQPSTSRQGESNDVSYSAVFGDFTNIFPGIRLNIRLRSVRHGHHGARRRPSRRSTHTAICSTKSSCHQKTTSAFPIFGRFSQISQIFNECRSAALIGDKSTMRRRHAAYPWVTSLRDESGNTLLIYAAMCDRADLCMWLLRHNAQPAVADAQGRTALHWATVKHARRTMKTLLTVGLP